MDSWVRSILYLYKNFRERNILASYFGTFNLELACCTFSLLIVYFYIQKTLEIYQVEGVFTQKAWHTLLPESEGTMILCEHTKGSDLMFTLVCNMEFNMLASTAFIAEPQFTYWEFIQRENTLLSLL